MNTERQTAYQTWIAILDRIAVAGPEEQIELKPKARAAYKRCQELDAVIVRKRITPPRYSQPDDEARDRAYAAEKDSL